MACSTISFLFIDSAFAQQERSFVNDNVARLVTAREIASSLNKKYGIRGSTVSASIESLNRSGYLCGVEFPAIGPDEGIPQIICEKTTEEYENCPVNTVTLHFDNGESRDIKEKSSRNILSSTVTRLSGFCPYVENPAEENAKPRSGSNLSLNNFVKKMDLIGKSPSHVIKDLLSLGSMCGYAAAASGNTLSFVCTMHSSRFVDCPHPRLEFNARIRSDRPDRTLFTSESASIESVNEGCASHR
jgi:hypothetical protein